MMFRQASNHRGFLLLGREFCFNERDFFHVVQFFVKNPVGREIGTFRASWSQTEPATQPCLQKRLMFRSWKKFSRNLGSGMMSFMRQLVHRETFESGSRYWKSLIRGHERYEPRQSSDPLSDESSHSPNPVSVPASNSQSSPPPQ